MALMLLEFFRRNQKARFKQIRQNLAKGDTWNVCASIWKGEVLPVRGSRNIQFLSDWIRGFLAKVLKRQFPEYKQERWFFFSSLDYIFLVIYGGLSSTLFPFPSFEIVCIWYWAVT
jgi:hypothetical protein